LAVTKSDISGKTGVIPIPAETPKAIKAIAIHPIDVGIAIRGAEIADNANPMAEIFFRPNLSDKCPTIGDAIILGITKARNNVPERVGDA